MKEKRKGGNEREMERWEGNRKRKEREIEKTLIFSSISRS